MCSMLKFNNRKREIRIDEGNQMGSLNYIRKLTCEETRWKNTTRNHEQSNIKRKKKMDIER